LQISNLKFEISDFRVAGKLADRTAREPVTLGLDFR
jgi:hypothetical protein